MAVMPNHSGESSVLKVLKPIRTKQPLDQNNSD